MKILYAILLNLCIFSTNCQSRTFLDDCVIKPANDCSHCTDDRLPDNKCVLTAVAHSTRDVYKLYYVSWYYNGTRMQDLLTSQNVGFTAAVKDTLCKGNCTYVAEIEASLHLPQPFSKRNYGNYTVKYGFRGETLTCSVLVCVKSKISTSEKDDNARNADPRDEIIIHIWQMYLIIGTAVVFVLLLISLIVKVLCLQRKASRNSRTSPRGSIRVPENDPVSSDEMSVSVSNHTYASVQLSLTPRYQSLISRNQGSHRYDEPTLQRDNNQIPEESDIVPTLTPTIVIQSPTDNDRQNSSSNITAQTDRKISSNSQTVVNTLVSKLDVFRSRQKTPSVPDIIVHDYQNIRKQRRLS